MGHHTAPCLLKLCSTDSIIKD